MTSVCPIIAEPLWFEVAKQVVVEAIAFSLISTLIIWFRPVARWVREIIKRMMR